MPARVEQGPRRIVAVAEPGGTGAARAQVGAPPAAGPTLSQYGVLRLRTRPYLPHSRLPAQQRLAPRTRGHDIHGGLKPRVQYADQRGQQHHVAEGAAPHYQGPPHTPGTGAGRAVATPMRAVRQPPNR